MMLRAIDLETTNDEPDVSIVEIGWCDVVRTPHWQARLPLESLLVNPGCAITPQSSAVHHIVDDDVRNEPRAEIVLPKAFDCPPDTVFCAHFADSDRAALGGDRGFKWIDTWKVAIHLAPKAPSYGLQFLRYWLDLDVERKIASPAHRAGPDAYVCAVMLERMLAKITVEEAIEISDRLVVFPRLNFGKHKGVPIAEVPYTYFEWILNEKKEDGSPSFDKHVLHTALTELDRRNNGPRR